MSLGERVFVFSDAGQREIAKEDLLAIPAEDREEAMSIYNELVKNGGLINLENNSTNNKVSLIEESHKKAKVNVEEQAIKDRTISVDDLKNNFHNLPKDEQNKILSSLEATKARNQKIAREEGFNRLPDDIKAGIGMPADNLKMLTKDQRTTLLKKLDDVLEIERKKHQDNLIAEAVK